MVPDVYNFICYVHLFFYMNWYVNAKYLFTVFFHRRSRDFLCQYWYSYMSQYFMMTSSNGNIFRFTGPLCGEFTGHRWIPITKASDAELWCFSDLRLNKRLSKQWRRWCFETPSRSLWRHSNVRWLLWNTFHAVILSVFCLPFSWLLKNLPLSLCSYFDSRISTKSDWVST